MLAELQVHFVLSQQVDGSTLVGQSCPRWSPYHSVEAMTRDKLGASISSGSHRRQAEAGPSVSMSILLLWYQALCRIEGVGGPSANDGASDAALDGGATGISRCSADSLHAADLALKRANSRRSMLQAKTRTRQKMPQHFRTKSCAMLKVDSLKRSIHCGFAKPAR